MVGGIPNRVNCHLTGLQVTAKPTLFQTVAPIDVRPFEVAELILNLFFAVSQFSGLVEGTIDISPTDSGRAFVGPVASNMDVVRSSQLARSRDVRIMVCHSYVLCKWIECK